MAASTIASRKNPKTARQAKPKASATQRERRKVARDDTHLELKVTAGDVQFVTRYEVISAGGMSFFSTESLRPGTLVSIECQRDGRSHVRAGRVRHCQKGHRIGLEFLD
jgi:hypothetical protein